MLGFGGDNTCLIQTLFRTQRHLRLLYKVVTRPRRVHRRRSDYCCLVTFVQCRLFTWEMLVLPVSEATFEPQLFDGRPLVRDLSVVAE
jgi:hypothetical protein